jgi:hypothetical protein
MVDDLLLAAQELEGALGGVEAQRWRSQRRSTSPRALRLTSTSGSNNTSGAIDDIL